MEIAVGTVTVKGQVTIPKEIRKILGISEGDRLIFQTEDGEVIIRKASNGKLSDVLRRQKPLGETSLDFQRRLREEWLTR